MWLLRGEWLSLLVHGIRLLHWQRYPMLVEVLLLLWLHLMWHRALVHVVRLARDQICVWWHLHLRREAHVYSKVCLVELSGVR